MPVVPRYAEVDQQGVVFNGHYLTWFDEACTGLLDHLGVGYRELMADGYDFQVMHSEIDFSASVRWRVAVRGHTVYVVVSTEDWAKRPVPDALPQALVRA